MEILPIPLKPGDKITIYSVNDGAMTTREEATVMVIFDEPQFRPGYVDQTPSVRGQWRYGIMKLKGKRKEHYLSCKPYCTLIVKGWYHMLRACDVYNKFSINACINLAGDTVDIKDLVNQNLNPAFTAHDILLSVEDPDHPIMVYPDAPSEHAVVQRMREEVSQ